MLFDLDGTLIDSAPDLAGACNDMRAAHGLAPLPFEALRPMVGSGARGMVGVAFSAGAGRSRASWPCATSSCAATRLRMTRSDARLRRHPPLLAELAVSRCAWGIVTNKAARFAEPLLAALGFAATRERRRLRRHDAAFQAAPRAACSKRRGEPASPPADCIYVGDDRRDVDAGRAAGMATVVAAWGYLGAGDPVDSLGRRCDHRAAGSIDGVVHARVGLEVGPLP